ncbi:MAG: recombinase family protein [Clostridia bacterium]|nr:recombinase family protein [Clostridia bacterium]
MKKNTYSKPNGNLAVIYARYSSHAQRDVSIDQQVKAITEYAAQRKLTIVQVYADRAISGTTDNRPEFKRMIEDAKAEAWQYVIVYSLDRFSRDRFDAITYKQILKSHGIRVLSAMENISEEPTGVILESVLEGLAQYYSMELSQKIRRGLNDNASKCMVAASIPFGYMKGPDNKYAINPETAPIVKEIFSRVLKGENYIDIARDLNERGIRTKSKSEWNRSSFKFLTNERYMGIYIYGDVRIEGGMPAIVDPETFYAVQAEVERRQNPKGAIVKRRRTNTVYLLTGKAYCDCCKSPLVGKSGTGRHGGFYTYYACKNMLEKNCDLKRVPQEKLEWFVAGVLKKFAMDPELVDLMVDISMKAQEERNNSSEMTLLRNELKQVESSINNITKAIEMGTISQTLLDRLSDLEKRRDTLKAQIATNEHRDKLDHLSREEMVAIFQLVQEGEIENKDFQELMFRLLLNSVYVGKETIKIVLKYKKDESSTIELPFDPDNIPEVEGSSKRIWWTLRELMQTPPSEQVKIPVTLRVYHSFAVIEIQRVA